MEKIVKFKEYDLLIEKIDIESELDRRGIEGKPSGNNSMICCPFHGESNPSLGIKIKGSSRGLFNCFSCGEKGNFFHLLAFIDNVSFEEIIRKYKSSDIDVGTIKRLKEYFFSSMTNEDYKRKIKVIDKKFLNKFKKPYGVYLNYLLNKRKISKKMVKDFNILCCDEGKWKGRIIIPVIDEKERLIGCTARYIYKCEKYEKVRKVKNSDVGKVLFGSHNIKHGTNVILVEGEIDMIYLQQYNVPAIQTGKNPTSYQMAKLIDFTDRCTLSLDGDVGKDFLRQKRNELSKYLSTDIIYLPEDKDPNDLSEQEIKKIYKDYKGGLK